MTMIDVYLIRFFNWLWKLIGGKPNENPFYFVLTGVRGDPYMFRYYLLRIRALNFKVHLHHIVRSDEDYWLHDHPWNFVSIVLWEGYTEETLTGTRRIRAGQVVRHRQRDAHRLTLRRPAWTLCFVTGKKKKWGFHLPAGWMESKKFFDAKYGMGEYIAH